MADVTLSTSSHTYDDLAKKYGDFMAPTAKVKLNGADATSTGMAITNVRVSTSTAVDTDTATLTIANAYDEIERDFAWTDKYALGSTIEVELGYKDQLTTVFSGYITAVNYSLPREGTPVVVVTGMDSSIKLMRGQKIETWQDKKVSDIAKQIASEHGLSSEVDDTGTKIPLLARGQQSDFQFLQNMAIALNYEFFIVGKKLYFRKRFANKSPVITLTYMKNLNEFSLEHNLSEQVSKVEVHAWNVKEQKELKGTATEIDKSNGNTKTGINLLQTMGGSNFIEHIYANVSSQEEANTLAKAILNGRALKLVTGEGEVVGLPELRAGLFIKIEGIGQKLDAAYYVSRATHILDGSGYVTQFQVQGNVV
ncbi:phage late control D family protein [Paenibacillus antri]|uniref:Phage late control D family protein n=1 Tax=Paenibacillus antri TaxID=2582848 RepID=A0A5R9GK92_9BACL|nr:contractile injection system protein, VgrG/Pvc8 family [Paenibacillus antri]TLS53974.1 phage late control D family protein [Paenibacillus antri]